MPSLQQVQDVLEKVLGTTPQPFHIPFWRGLTRDELVSKKLFGRSLIVVGQPEKSYLLLALRSGASGPLRAYFGQASAEGDDLAVIEQWIRNGCPEVAPIRSARIDSAGNDQHTKYWRAIDFFFHPKLASPVTKDHVLRLHGDALQEWIPTMLKATDPARWPNYLAQPKVAESFAYVRYHQRRLIVEYYNGSQGDILDSLWKFGGRLLPIDPTHPLPPIQYHTMNSVLDWFFWVPYLDASLRASDGEAIDLDLARGWQIGIVGDGLLRTDGERPPGQRMPISDFAAGDPDLRAKVVAKYVAVDGPTMITEMVRRARESTLFD
jgi:hypothetical protein